MFISDEKKFVYFAIPKTGSYSIHNFFGYRTGHPLPDEHHMGVRRFVKDYSDKQDYFKFAFTRNPWSKIVATYFDFTLRRGKEYAQGIVYDQPLLSEFKDFNDFCIRLKDSEWRHDIFFVPQIELVTLENDLPISFIGKFENLNEDMKEVCSRLGIQFRPLEHANKGLYDKSYRDYYNDEARRAIEELYLTDLEMFNYEF
jgi:hypothetical protein